VSRAACAQQLCSFSRVFIRHCSMPSIADESPLQAKSSGALTRLWRSFGFFFSGRSDDLEEGLLGNGSQQRRNSNSIKRDILVTLLVMCASLFVRFLWLLLTIVGDIMAADKSMVLRGACAEDHSNIFLLFITANSVPWVIYAVHIIAQPLPVLITVWTMGQVGDNTSRPRR
jgi:hypothetical protein